MSDVDTLTLAEFLLARIAEDEAVARAAGEPSAEWWGSNGKIPGRVVTPHGYAAELARYEGAPDDALEFIARFDPARVLAECEAKRKIVELHKTVESIYRCDMCSEGNDDLASFPCETLRVVAAVYADHPDYRDEWKP